MGNQETPTDDNQVKTVQTSFRILELLRQNNGATLNELTGELGMAKSTVHRHLNTLMNLRYVVKTQGTYHVSLKSLQLSEHARHRRDGFQTACDKVVELGNETGERAVFLTEEFNEGIYVYRRGGSPSFRDDTRVGEYHPLYVLAAGKAILSQWDEKRFEEYLDRRQLEAFTSETITNKDSFREEIRRVREQGFAVNDSEQIEGLRAVGVPVFNPSNEVIGGLSVFGPVTRFDDRRCYEDLPNLLKDKAAEIRVEMRLE